MEESLTLYYLNYCQIKELEHLSENEGILSKTPSISLIIINLLALSFFAIALAAVSPLILKVWLFLPNPKGAIIGILFLLIQGISEVLKSYYAAKKGKWPDSIMAISVGPANWSIPTFP